MCAIVSSTVVAADAPLGNTSRSKGGVTIVVTSTTITDAENTSVPMSPFESPYPATIRPTSPREIIPTPTRSDCRGVKPHHLAKSAHPAALATIATSTRATVKSPRSPSSRPLACNPMPMKNTGTKIEYANGCTPPSISFLNSVCAISTPAMYAPVIAATCPTYSAAHA